MASAGFDVIPVAGRIGAEVVGLDLRSEPSDAVIADLRKTLVEHKVVFLREQHLDQAGQIAFARRFGPITGAHPTLLADQQSELVLDLDYGRTVTRANNWHTDVTFVDRPPLGSILRAIVVPPAGGDTLWANTVAAYDDLPPALRTFADSAWAVHSNAYDYVKSALDVSAETSAYRTRFESTHFETLHPLVRVHPESGERALYIGGFLRQIRGLSSSESADLNRALQAYVTRPENTVRWRWKAGDIAFWDNRGTQHYAIADYGDQPRHMQRVTINGDLPVGIDGRTSEVIQGDASAYYRGRAAA